jgi:hypothetical protein
MNRRLLSIVAVVVVCVQALLMTMSKRKVSPRSGSALSDSVYNPYSPGILPSNLNSEIARVLREVDVIKDRALARWHALPPPTLTGQPPVLTNIGTETIETLGELMLFDKNVAQQKSSVRVLPHAIRRLRRADPLGQPDDDRVSRNGSHSGGQADGAATPVFTILPYTPTQSRAGSVLWWKLLRFTRDRIFAEDSRRRTGTESSRRYFRNGLP